MPHPSVDVRENEPGILQITMQDQVEKNALTPDLVMGLHQAFAEAASNERCKVVVLTGYGNYFCTGGTRAGLLNIQDGDLRFSDLSLHDLVLNCKVPVISAMQGHAIGSGFTMGLFADFVLLSRESIYTCNYLDYGFTPGMGATYIMPRKIGITLASELLFSAGRYMGADLEKRGIPFRVLPRAQVLPTALEIARSLVTKPRLTLVTLKDSLTAKLRAELPAAIALETQMHDLTFHQPEVKSRINAQFGK